MRLLLLSLLGVLGLLSWIWRTRPDRKAHGDFSGDWWADERLKAMRRIQEFEGVSVQGKFKR